MEIDTTLDIFEINEYGYILVEVVCVEHLLEGDDTWELRLICKKGYTCGVWETPESWIFSNKSDADKALVTYNEVCRTAKEPPIEKWNRERIDSTQKVKKEVRDRNLRVGIGVIIVAVLFSIVGFLTR